MNDSAFLVTNASGRHINLLNDNQQEQPPILFAAPSPPSSEVSDETSPTITNNNDIPVTTNSLSKRKYHCTEPGCTKSFTTSGHLARHNRIHTGEKNFPCLFPGCQSRFSRQDNMMQHYRTHMSPKSRRTQQKKIISEDLHPRPKLHAHQRIRSDPYRVERPLTIDQHLNNYKRSLLSNTSSSIRYNMPTPLGSVAASHMQQKQNNNSILNANGTWSIEPVSHQTTEETEDEEDTTTTTTTTTDYTPPQQTYTSDTLFYQHRPLTFNSNVSFLPFTLLHPTRAMSSSPPIRIQQQQQQKEHHIITNSPPLLSSTSTSSSSISTTTTTTTTTTTENNNNNNNSASSSSQAGLLQLAHIVSTFG